MSLKLTRRDIDRILHHAHFIPVSKGITKKFITENYSGWALGEFKEVFDSAKILVVRQTGCGWRFHWNLKELVINGDLNVDVVWNEETRKDDGRFLGINP